MVPQNVSKGISLSIRCVYYYQSSRRSFDHLATSDVTKGVHFFFSAIHLQFHVAVTCKFSLSLQLMPETNFLFKQLLHVPAEVQIECEI